MKLGTDGTGANGARSLGNRRKNLRSGFRNAVSLIGECDMTTAAKDNEQTAPESQQAELRARIKRLGEAGAAKELGISRSALLRAAGGFAVRPGTLALLREKLRAAS
jgi:hypothetical protein